MQRSTGRGAYLPVGLTLVDQGHDAEDLDLLDLADVADLLTDLADIEGIVVALGLRLGVGRLRVLPGLCIDEKRTSRESHIVTSARHRVQCM